ncbi:hypothetical protein SAMN04488550_0097 [Gordonia malaquae]|nr:hypothetical protein SAMN04488550_0097 [Gordonia malaquae]
MAARDAGVRETELRVLSAAEDVGALTQREGAVAAVFEDKGDPGRGVAAALRCGVSLIGVSLLLVALGSGVLLVVATLGRCRVALLVVTTGCGRGVTLVVAALVGVGLGLCVALVGRCGVLLLVVALGLCVALICRSRVLLLVVTLGLSVTLVGGAA